MLRYLLCCLILSVFLYNSDFVFAESIVLKTAHFQLTVSEKGQVEQFLDLRDGTNYLNTNADRIFCVLRPQKDKYLSPQKITRNADRLTISFVDSPIVVNLHVQEDRNLLHFDLESITGGAFYALQFARVPLKIDYAKTDFAATAMSRKINTNTLDYPGHSQILGGVCFSKIGFDGAGVTLIALEEPKLRDVMKTVVDSFRPGEMPVSRAGGPYAMDNPKNQGNYIITSEPLTEDKVGEWCEHLAKFGVNQVDFHQGTPFRHGDFHFNEKAYPGGVADFRKTSEALKRQGMIAGLHTYAEFLSQDCRFVSPVPHKDLDVMRTFTLAEDLAADATRVSITESTADVSEITGFFVRNSKILRIGDELILFGKPAKEAPYGFTECQRGAYGTKVSAHKKGEPVGQLTLMFGLLAPKVDSELFLEIARETARTYNEGGFDMIYLDALDGTSAIADDPEYIWYYDALFVNEILKHVKTPPLLEYSTMHPSLWYGRSRMGAWDSAHRGYQSFFDKHVATNLDTADRYYLPGQFGWLCICPSIGDDMDNFQYDVFFREDVEYLGAKILGHNYGLSFLDIQESQAQPATYHNGTLLKQYDDLRQGHVFPETVLNRLKEPGKHFSLIRDPQGRPQFVEADYGRAILHAGQNAFEYDNPFSRQKPKLIRIENRYLTANYDGENAIDLIPLDENKPVEAMTTAQFPEPLDLSQHLGLGIWVYGDSGRQQINIRVDSSAHLVSGHTDHFIDVDFTGWKYFSLVEADNGTRTEVNWPISCGNHYHEYRQKVHYNSVSEVCIMIVGDVSKLRFRTLKAIPIVENHAVNPTLDIDNEKVTFQGKIKNGHYMEWTSGEKATVYDSVGNAISEMTLSGPIPDIPKGKSTVRLIGTNESGDPTTARVTFGIVCDKRLSLSDESPTSAK